MDQGLAARRTALVALTWVLKDRRMLAQFRLDPKLDGADAARAQRLTTTVLRHLGPIDALLTKYIDRKPPFPARLILRLAVAELMVAGEASHGVIDSAVALLKSRRNTFRYAGLANATLRRIAEEGPAIWDALPPQLLPGWIGGELKKRFGFDAVRAIEVAHAKGAALDITYKTLKDAPEGGNALPTGSIRFAPGTQVTALTGYDEGNWWVQDAAAALPVRLMGDIEGKTVVDLCAAPGGKTLQMAALGADVTAVDLSKARVERLKDNLKRTGLSATVVVGDALEREGLYDAVLLDAPCSATGTIRRHPDLPFVKSPKETEALTRLQMRMIDHAITLVRPGGRLVFCTCSLLPVEGEFQVKAALKRHQHLSVVPIDPVALGGEPHWLSAEGGLRLRPDFWPEIGGIDGFYMAALQVG